MTKLPLEDRAVEGVADGPPYEMNLRCAAPGCELLGSERHHIWRRSFLIGDYEWVRLPQGALVANCVKLCGQHHHAVTVNAAWIRLDDSGVFTWADMLAPARPLTWQPPAWRDDEPIRHSGDSDADSDPDPDGPDLREGRLDADAGVPHDADGHGVHGSDALNGTCPTCLRPLPHKTEKPEGARPRRTWSITVPKDEREDGAETLDTLLEEARKEMARAGLPYGSEDTVRFFVLAQALGLFVAHAEEVLT